MVCSVVSANKNMIYRIDMFYYGMNNKSRREDTVVVCKKE